MTTDAEQQRAGARIRFARCAVDLARGVLCPADGGRELALSRRERALLEVLAAAAPAAVPRDELYRRVWGRADDGTRACDTAMRRLRVKLELDPAAPRHLLTAHGSGYQLVPLADAPAAPAASGPAPRIGVGAAQVDLDGLRFRVGDRDGRLTAAEARLLRELARADGRVVPRDALERAGWGEASPSGRRLDQAVARIRAKLDPDGAALATARGGGYQLRADTSPRRAAPPAEVDRRFGPDARVHAVVAALRDHRRVTLWGPGGIGKTRLAAAVCRRMGDSVWVAAASAASGEQLAGVVAGALGLPDPGGFTVARVGGALREAGMGVLALDNVEQIPDVDEAVRAWLAAAADLRVLSTSRMDPGEIDGERAIEVLPLALPDAVALFVDRSGRDDDSADVAALVADLGGHPLAIELAAARTALNAASARSLPPLRVLATRDPSRPERHRSLRASLAASLAQVPDPARGLLVRLPVFAGAFRADAAARILRPADGELAVIELLDPLVDWCLLTADARGRYALLPMVAEFLTELADPATRASDEVAHGRFFAAPLPSDPDGPDEAQVRIELERDRADLVAAVRRALSRGDAVVALGALDALRRVEVHATVAAWAERLADTAPDSAIAARAALFAATAWHHADDTARAAPWLARARALADEPPGEVHVELWAAEFLHARRSGDRDALAPTAERWLAAARAHGRPTASVGALAAVARQRSFVIDHAGAISALREAVRIADACGGPTCRATARFELGAIAMYAGQLAESLAILDEAAQLAPERADVQHSRSSTLFALGRHAEAAAAARTAMAMARRTGGRHAWAMAAHAEALAEFHQGHVGAAEEGFLHAAAAFRELGLRHAHANCVAARTQVYFVRGDLPAALRCVDEVLALGSDSLDGWARGARAMLRARLHGEHSAAIRELEPLQARASGVERALLRGWIAESWFELGDLASAQILLEEVRDEAARVAPRMLDQANAISARILGRLGRVDEARARLAGASRGGDPVSRANHDLAAAEIALAAGDRLALRAALARAEGELPPESLGARFAALRAAAR